jgi:hypothetical protein
MKEPKYDVMITVVADKGNYKATTPRKKVSMNQALKEAKHTAENINFTLAKVAVESITIKFKRVENG